MCEIFVTSMAGYLLLLHLFCWASLSFCLGVAAAGYYLLARSIENIQSSIRIRIRMDKIIINSYISSYIKDIFYIFYNFIYCNYF
jgi:hypothetical protein